MLLTPSWISGLIVVVVGLAFSIGVITAFEVHNSTLQQQLLGWQVTQPAPALASPGQVVSESNRPTLQGSWSLLLLWSLVGLLVYGMVATIIHSIVRAEGFRRSLRYVHANPATMLASTAEHLLLRAIAAIILVSFTVAFWKLIVPYGITAADASAASVMSFYGVLYALMSFGLIALSMHIQVILLRLAVGRPRVFSGV